MHVKGYPAPETKAAVERARRLIEQVETLAERPEDPLALYSVLYGVWSANYTMYNGAAIRELAGQFLELAVKDGTKIPLMVGHRLMASSGAFYAASSVAPEIPERRGGKAAPRQVTADD